MKLFAKIKAELPATTCLHSLHVQQGSALSLQQGKWKKVKKKMQSPPFLFIFLETSPLV